MDASVLVAILFALGGAVFYALFSKIYDPLVERLEIPAVCATILYGLSAFLLFFTALIAAFCFGFTYELPEKATILNVYYTHNQLVIPLILSICVMAIAYAIHIVSEAEARAGTSISTYSILFQANVIVIAVIDIFFNQTPINVLIVLGAAAIILASTGAFINNNGFISRTNVRILAISMLSAITCGVALYIDGTLSEQFIFGSESPFKNLALFLFYEMLTFLLPMLLTLLLLFYRLKKNTFAVILSIYTKNKNAFWLSAVFAALQFVCSVFALSYSEHRLVAAAILGTAPIFSVFLDKKPRISKNPAQRAIDYIFAIFTLLGVVLVSYQKMY